MHVFGKQSIASNFFVIQPISIIFEVLSTSDFGLSKTHVELSVRFQESSSPGVFRATVTSAWIGLDMRTPRGRRDLHSTRERFYNSQNTNS